MTKSATILLIKQLPGMLLGLALAALPLWAVPQNDNAVETSSTVTSSAAEAPAIPHLVRFSGVIRDTAGKVAAGTVNLNFSFYTQEQGGTAIWSESQNVTLNSQGHYAVLLGASQSSGIPADLFSDNQVRWVGVQAQLPDAAENPRVLLTDVPYALKAADSETLGGKPASAYVTRDTLNTLASQSVESAASAAAAESSSTRPALGGTGTANFVPLWLDNNGTLGDSALFQTGSGSTARVGINTTAPQATLDVQGSARIDGTLVLPITGTASATAGKNSQPIELSASAFNGPAQFSVNENFLWMAEPAGNNTVTPTGKLNLLFAAGTNPPAETGLSIASNGVMTFARGQKFPGTGAVTGVTAGTDLTGGGISGNVTLNLDTTKIITGITAGTDLIGGGAKGPITLSLDTTKVPQLNGSNSFVGNQYISQPKGTIASPELTIQADDDASFRSVPHQLHIQGASIPGQQLLIGYITGGGSNSDSNGGWGAIQATWAGVENTPLSLQPGGGCVCIQTGLDPFSVYGFPLAIGQGRGGAIADSWYHYSSRRWKMNIQPLQGSLTAIEKLRPVSYDLKNNGKHEIGLIAEEVGAVVPEVVQWEKNGKDAKGLDYARLTALLIDATKEQQKQIHDQQMQLKLQGAQITELRSEVKTMQASLKANGRNGSGVRTVKAHVSMPQD